MNIKNAHKAIENLCSTEKGRTILHGIINALAEPECKHYHLELRNNGKHECLNCSELFSVEKLR